MSKLLYRIGIFIYILGIRLVALFDVKATRWLKGREGVFNKLQQTFTSNKSPVIWIHCASLGEFEQGRPLIEVLKKKHPEYKVLLTFFSPSGYEHCKNYKHADWIFYLPADSPSNALQFINIVEPKLVFFVKYEFWYYYLTQLKSQQIPTYLISAIFRPNQLFFKWYGGIFREMLSCFKHIFVQDDSSITLLKKVGFNKGIIAGDTRLDRVLTIKSQRKQFSILEEFCEESQVIICGSTWPADEVILAEFIKNNPTCKLVIAPHQIDEAHLQQIEQTFKFATPLRYSQKPNRFALKTATILIIDNIGMLSSLYAYGDIAYIGGGFGAGIHNILEAVVYEIPVLFGSKHQKFKEAKDLIQDKVAFEIHSAENIATLGTKMQDPAYINNIAIKAKQYLAKHQGATSIIIDKINLK
jgi:3-deoxy-D-manno-octulosonic-acid transferase